MIQTINQGCRAMAAVGLCVALTISASGCSPIVTLAGAALGSLGGGASGSAPTASGVQGIGAPSLAQNAHTTSPVQNHKPPEHAIRDVLNHADNQSVRDSCLKQLTPEEGLPVTECTNKLACIPGLSVPLMMRVCPATTSIAQAGGQSDVPDHATYAGPVWRWEDPSGL